MTNEYTNERNKLIPIAHKYADRAAGSEPKSIEFRDIWAGNWNRAFHSEMDRLWEIERKKIKRVRRNR